MTLTTTVKTSTKVQGFAYLDHENHAGGIASPELGKPMTPPSMPRESVDGTLVKITPVGVRRTGILVRFSGVLDETRTQKVQTDFLIKEVDLVKPVAKTLKQWIDDNFGDNAALNRKLTRILSGLKKSNPVVYEKTIHSEQTYTREELEAMAQFIGAVRLPRGFNISKVLDEAENAYYGVL